MFTTIINDCRDDNAKSRQESRVGSLLETSISFIGVNSDIEASMHLVDILDATYGKKGLILVNVAPRGGAAKKWENGTPFAYFWFKDTLVVSSIDGFTLSGIKALNLIEKVQLLDIHTAVDAMFTAGFISQEEAWRIPFSQFRSFDFTPRIGAFLSQIKQVPNTDYPLSEVKDLPAAIWHIDNFGNAKTTIPYTENVKEGGKINTRFGEVSFYEHLRDVPDGETALVKGSSGLKNNRFLEILTQRRNFAKISSAKIGDDIYTETSHFHQATE